MNDPMLSLPGLSSASGIPVVAKFDGGLLSSDGGILALRIGPTFRTAPCSRPMQESAPRSPATTSRRGTRPKEGRSLLEGSHACQARLREPSGAKSRTKYTVPIFRPTIQWRALLVSRVKADPLPNPLGPWRRVGDQIFTVAPREIWVRFAKLGFR